jgi:hypothetical protein
LQEIQKKIEAQKHKLAWLSDRSKQFFAGLVLLER